MLKKSFNLLAATFFMAPIAAIAKPSAFTYKTNCWVQAPSSYVGDICTVVETREDNGALRTRNIFSNRFGLTVKSRFDPVKGFVTWDSYNKFEYKWEYKVGSIDGKVASYVMPGFLLEDVSWD